MRKKLDFAHFEQLVSKSGYKWMDFTVWRSPREELEALPSRVWRAVDENPGKELEIIEQAVEQQVADLPRTVAVPVRGLTIGVPTPVEPRRYFPFKEEPRLFYDFANLNASEASIQRFANEYGMLGVGEWGYVGEQVFYIETLEEWDTAIRKVHCAFMLADTLLSKDDSAIRGLVKRVDHARYEFRCSNKSYFLSPRFFPPVVQRQVEKDYVLAYMLFFWQLVNEELRFSTHAKLGLSPKSEFDTRYEPSNLLGAVWLQLASALEKKTLYKRCARCGEWPDLHKPYARRDTKYCSGACKQKAYRDRVRERKASKLADERRSVGESAV